MYWRALFAASASLILANTAEANAVTGNVTVTKMFVQTELGEGDVAFEVTTPVAGCAQGFWLRPSDPGFKVAYAALLSAYHTQAQLLVYASTLAADRWSGSSSVYCRVTALVPVL